MRRVMDAALMRGFDVEAYHCALDPSRIEHLVIPALGVAVVNSVEPHFYQPQEGDTVLQTMSCVKPVGEQKLLAERDTAREMYRRSLEEAVNFIRRAKEVHDEMEAYYTPHMNFADIEARRQQVLSRILDLAAGL